MTHTITLIPGDGIGPEVTEAVVRILKASGVSIVHIGETALDALPLLRHVRAGGLVALQIDRAVGRL